jgi:hypothetical protein
MPKKAPSKVSVPLSPELLAIVDEEVARLKSLGSKLRITRAVAIQALVRRHARNLRPADIKAVYEQCLREAGPLKLHGVSRASLGEIGPARQAFLRAAAFELLALSSLDDVGDATIIQHLAEVVELIKKGTGYKALPDGPQGAKLLSTVGSA